MGGNGFAVVLMVLSFVIVFVFPVLLLAGIFKV